MKLDRLVEIQRGTVARNSLGDPVETWATAGTVYATVADVSANEVYRAQEVGAQISTRFTVRYSRLTTRVSATDRIIWRGRIYNITQVREKTGTRNSWMEIDAVARDDVAMQVTEVPEVIPDQDEAVAFFARMTTPPSVTFRAALNRFVYDLKQANIYSTLSRLYVLGGDTQSDSYRNVLSDNFTLSAFGGVVTFETWRGMTGDGTSEIDGMGAGNIVLGSAISEHLSFMTTKAGNLGNNLGYDSGSFNILISREGHKIVGRLNSASDISANALPGVGVVTSRRDGIDLYTEIDGVNVITTTAAAATLASAIIEIGAAVTTRSTDRHFVVAAGTYIDAEQSSLFSTACFRLAAALGWVPPSAPIQLTRPPLTTSVLPDGASHSQSGHGFTCTGAAKDPTDGTWWVVNYGAIDASDVSLNGRVGSIVHLNSSLTSIVGEIASTSLSLPTDIELQGLCYDTSNDTLWVASPSEGKIYNISKAGSLLGNINFNAANGIAYNSLTDSLIVNTLTNLFTDVNKSTGSVDGDQFSIPEIDQMWFDEDNNRLILGAGSNGSNGVAHICELSNDFGYPLITKTVELQGSTASEGVVLDGTTLYSFSDDRFHGTSLDNNRVLTYNFSGI